MAFRQPPTGNRLCVAAQRKRDAESHKERMGTNPHAVDAMPPKTFSLTINKAKKDQLTDEMCDKIDRENRLLLRRMGEIIQSHTLDVVHPSYKRSLNEGQRRRELKKITSENHAILHRLTERRAHYDREEWQAHKERHDAYLENIREKPIPATPIPVPRFLRDGSLTQRPSHAYIPNLSKLKSDPAGPPSYASGSQSARGPASSSQAIGGSNVVYVHTPNRTGTSKSGSTLQRTHQLQPLPQTTTKQNNAPANKSRSPHPPSSPSHTQPTSSRSRSKAAPHSPTDSSLTRVMSNQALRAGCTPIMQAGRNLGDSYVIVSVHEVPHSNHAPNEEKQNNQPLTASATPVPTDFISSSSPPLSGHALMFRSYDPLYSDDRSLTVPYSTLVNFSELVAQPALLDTQRRAELATLLLTRLSLVGHELRFDVAPTAGTGAVKSVAADGEASAGSASASASAPAPAPGSEGGSSAPLVTRDTHAVAYTDSTGIDYYLDTHQNEYLPFPPVPVPTHTQAFMDAEQTSTTNTYALPTQK